jgi:hypothetical protein
LRTKIYYRYAYTWEKEHLGAYKVTTPKCNTFISVPSCEH